MKYIRPTPNPSGAFPPPQSTPALGLLSISDELAAVVVANKGFVSIGHEDGAVKYVLPLSDKLEHWEQTHVPELGTMTPSEQREEAYNTQPIIEWEGKQLTVTQAATKWYYYAAEGSPKADELQALIVAAKENIRTQYPDEEVSA